MCVVLLTACAWARFITQQSFQLEQVTKAPAAVTGAVSWRKEGIRHKKNEVFLDVVESVNLLVNSHGSIIHSEVAGAIRIRCMLSGTPELRLGLNDKILFEASGRRTPPARRARVLPHATLCSVDVAEQPDGGDGGRQVPPVRPAEQV